MKEANISAEDKYTDTIAAIATPPGTGGVGIIRISGPKAAQILDSVFVSMEKGGAPSARPRYMCYGAVRCPEEGRELDRCLAVFMAAPHSYTGEDVAELQCHGGSRLLEQVLALCLRQGARMATPGEFTLRAFLNGRMDLTQAEAVADIIAAKTPKAMSLAQRQLSGALSQKVLDMEASILEVLADITVGVDFPDDEDAPDEQELIYRVSALLADMRELLRGGKLGLAYREGVRAVLAGAVNAGKSSLMNVLLGRERAIVTSEAGTTRDTLEETVDICGIPLCLTDTAGLRQQQGMAAAEQLGIDRSRAYVEEAALLLAVADASAPADKEFLSLLDMDKPCIIIMNKTDLTDDELPEYWKNILPADKPICQVSAASGKELKRQIALLCSDGIDPEAASPLVNNVRHMEALEQAAASLCAALETLEAGFTGDIAGVELEEACAALGRLTGKEVSEDVLTQIFSKFCVGK